ncbi:hypothetical protein PR048_019365 [Dryococelus australis]|uniref:Uncharacterized protein n=1 Tax=Dryococelus australis TaxID=614101 RepID=A0ABQ9H3B5_9NEOP|nr:hypothetical protein PR048_019365 [Dryococelus australis]
MSKSEDETDITCSSEEELPTKHTREQYHKQILEPMDNNYEFARFMLIEDIDIDLITETRLNPSKRLILPNYSIYIEQTDKILLGRNCHIYI